MSAAIRAQMSVVPQPDRNMAGSRRPANGTRAAATNWFLLHLLACFVFLVGFKACLHAYLNSTMPFGPAANKSDNVVGADTDANAVPTSDLIAARTKSPLQELSWMETDFQRLSEEDAAVYSDIEKLAALDVKFFAIPETFHPQNGNTLLYGYVEKQLQSAKHIITAQQAELVLELIESGVVQGSLVKKEVGEKGSLRNSVVVALMKEEGSNLHFAMAAVSMEPRLGWRLITKKQRNEWNDVLSRVVDTRLRQELANFFNAGAGIHKRLAELKKPEEGANDSVTQVFAPHEHLQ